MASPVSLAATSEVDPPSSPAQPEAKSFVSRAMSEDDDTQMGNATPDPQEKSSRAKSKASQNKDKDKDKDAANQPTIGKIRHLKKEDGEPLWREDIQYDFLKAVFDNEQSVFTNSYEPKRLQRQCFADLYIDTMSRSSKTSKVLRDKLLSDREAAKGMAMVCLLVNMGRMNTTLNCRLGTITFKSLLLM
jgi:Ino eighty subunit 1